MSIYYCTCMHGFGTWYNSCYVACYMCMSTTITGCLFPLPSNCNYPPPHLHVHSLLISLPWHHTKGGGCQGMPPSSPPTPVPLQHCIYRALHLLLYLLLYSSISRHYSCSMWADCKCRNPILDLVSVNLIKRV